MTEAPSTGHRSLERCLCSSAAIIDISNPVSFGGEKIHQPHFLIMILDVGGNYTGITGNPGDMRLSIIGGWRRGDIC